MTLTDFIQLENSRANCYNLLTALFCQPTDIIKTDKIYNKLIENLQIINPNIVDDVKQLKKLKRKYSEQDLLINYTKIFIGPFGAIAHPYSSMYFGKSNAIMSEETLWVYNFYNKNGLKLDTTSPNNIPDHITIELEFIYYLIYKELSAFNEFNDIKKIKKHYSSQKNFIENHLKIWAPKMCDKIINSDCIDFYKTLAGVLKKFILQENFNNITKIKN